MNLVYALLGEHGSLRHQLAALRLAAPGYTDKQLRAAALALAEAVESHAELEDELLLDPLADDARVPRGPVDAMRAEHRRIEAQLERLLLPAGVPGAGDPHRVLGPLVETVLHHFAHEENVLFPLAMELVSADTLEALGSKWAARRGVEIRLCAPGVAV